MVDMTVSLKVRDQNDVIKVQLPPERALASTSSSTARCSCFQTAYFASSWRICQIIKGHEVRYFTCALQCNRWGIVIGGECLSSFISGRVEMWIILRCIESGCTFIIFTLELHHHWYTSSHNSIIIHQLLRPRRWHHETYPQQHPQRFVVIR